MHPTQELDYKKFLSFKDAAKFLNISIRQLRNLKKLNKIKYLQPSDTNGHVKFRVEWLEEYINKNIK